MLLLLLMLRIGGVEIGLLVLAVDGDAFGETATARMMRMMMNG